MGDLAGWIATIGGLLLILGGATVGVGGVVLALPVLFGYGLEPWAVRLFALGAGLIVLGLGAVTAGERIARRPDT